MHNQWGKSSVFDGDRAESAITKSVTGKHTKERTDEKFSSNGN